MSKLRERLAEIKEEAEGLRDELTELVDVDELSDDQEARFAELTDEENPIERLAAEKGQVETRLALLDKADDMANLEVGEDRTAPHLQKNEDPYEMPEFGVTRSEYRGRALKAIEAESSYDLTDAQKQAISHLIERKDDKRSSIAARVLATGSKAYKDGWTKKVTGRDFLMTDEERQAMERAMSLTDGEGGFAVPFPIDPTLIQLGDGSSNPFRVIGRVETGTTDTWQGLASTELTASFDNQVTEVSDDATTFTQPQITAEFAQAFVPASIEIEQDYPNLVADLQMLFLDGKDRLEATAFATGSGTNEPFGIVTAIDGTANDIATATTDVFAIEDVYTVHQTLGPRYRDRGTWVGNVAIINDIRRFGTADSHAFSVHLTENAPLRILGLPITESSAMDGVIDALAENNILVMGDFSNYLIYDRVGFSLEFIPHLFNTANNLPDGRRGWYAHWRVGADSINDGAFVLLNAT